MGGFPWVSDPQNPSTWRDKGGEERGSGRSGGGGGAAVETEGDTEGGGGGEVHFSSAASHPVHVTMEDLEKKKKKLSFAPQQRRGEECSWAD